MTTTIETPNMAIARLLTEAGFKAADYGTHVLCYLKRSITGIEVQAALPFEVASFSFDMPDGRIAQLVRR